MSLKARSNIMLFITALIWGTAFVTQKIGMNYMEPFTFNGIRTLIGAVVLTPVIMYFDRQKKKEATAGSGNSETAGAAEGREGAAAEGASGEILVSAGSGEGPASVSGSAGSADSEKKWLLLGGFCCGMVLFIGGSLQQVALQTVSAGKAGFITALYIVLVPILGIFIKKKIRPIVWLCVAVAAVGLFLLCVPKGESLSGIGFGEILLFISSIWFALHLFVVDFFVARVDGVRLSRMQFLVCGLVSLVPMFLFESPSMSAIIAGWFPLVYTGVFSQGVAYTFQVVAQKHTNPTSAALIMSLESVFSVIAEAIILHEMMSGREITGCILMFAAIIVTQLPEKKTAEQ